MLLQLSVLLLQLVEVEGRIGKYCFVLAIAVVFSVELVAQFMHERIAIERLFLVGLEVKDLRRWLALLLVIAETDDQLGADDAVARVEVRNKLRHSPVRRRLLWSYRLPQEQFLCAKEPDPVLALLLDLVLLVLVFVEFRLQFVFDFILDELDSLLLWHVDRHLEILYVTLLLLAGSDVRVPRPVGAGGDGHVLRLDSSLHTFEPTNVVQLCYLLLREVEQAQPQESMVLPSAPLVEDQRPDGSVVNLETHPLEDDVPLHWFPGMDRRRF